MSPILDQLSTPQYHGDQTKKVILFSVIARTLLIYDSQNTVGLVPGL